MTNRASEGVAVIWWAAFSSERAKETSPRSNRGNVETRMPDKDAFIVMNRLLLLPLWQ